jgi:hypothetical protein
VRLAHDAAIRIEVRQLLGDRFCPRDEVIAEPVTDDVVLRNFVELRLRVDADGLQQPISGFGFRAVVAHDERLADQCADGVQHR